MNSSLSLLRAVAFALPLFVASAGSLRGQETNELVELEAFSVSSGASEREGYTPAAAPRPEVAITIKKPASALVMEVTLMNATDKADARNRELAATLEAVERAVRGNPAIKLEKREIQLRGDNRRRYLSSIVSKSGVGGSGATVLLVAELKTDSDPFELVKGMRATLASVAPTGTTRVLDGPVSLLMRNPDTYRREILEKIFEDRQFVQKGIGAEFEVLPTGLDGPVKVRPSGDRDVELWISYRFAIRSVRELENARAKEKG